MSRNRKRVLRNAAAILLSLFGLMGFDSNINSRVGAMDSEDEFAPPKNQNSSQNSNPMMSQNPVLDRGSNPNPIFNLKFGQNQDSNPMMDPNQYLNQNQNNQNSSQNPMMNWNQNQNQNQNPNPNDQNGPNSNQNLNQGQNQNLNQSQDQSSNSNQNPMMNPNDQNSNQDNQGPNRNSSLNPNDQNSSQDNQGPNDGNDDKKWSTKKKIGVISIATAAAAAIITGVILLCKRMFGQKNTRAIGLPAKNLIQNPKLNNNLNSSNNLN